MNIQPKISCRFGAVALLLLISISPANEATDPKANMMDAKTKDFALLYQAFGQIGSGSIGDDYVGTSRIVESDLGLGLRILPGVSWKHFALSLNVEYLLRQLNLSETATVPGAPPPEMKQLKYMYFKIQPEFSLKTSVSQSLEVGLVSGFGFRSIINNSPKSGGLDESIVLGAFGQFKRINIRISQEFFYQNVYNSESMNASIGFGYSQSL